jgi:hypothetical protein
MYVFVYVFVAHKKYQKVICVHHSLDQLLDGNVCNGAGSLTREDGRLLENG